jgi:hypothetical protein
MTGLDDDAEIAWALDEFRQEYGRGPHSSHELMRWYDHYTKNCSIQINDWLGSEGLCVNAKGQIICKDDRHKDIGLKAGDLYRFRDYCD